MIPSKKSLEEAFDCMAEYYDKVLLVDTNKDTFRPIKVATKEYERLYGAITFSEWIDEFSFSPYCNKEACVNFYQFNSLESLKLRESPAYIKYKKLIDGEYHDVIEEIIPVGDGQVYLFIKDLTKMGYEAYYD